MLQRVGVWAEHGHSIEFRRRQRSEFQKADMAGIHESGQQKWESKGIPGVLPGVTRSPWLRAELFLLCREQLRAGAVELGAEWARMKQAGGRAERAWSSGPARKGRSQHHPWSPKKTAPRGRPTPTCPNKANSPKAPEEIKFVGPGLVSFGHTLQPSPVWSIWRACPWWKSTVGTDQISYYTWGGKRTSECIFYCYCK